MKNYKQVSTALELFSMASFISNISNKDEYHQALKLMDELIEEYDLYKPLIDVLSISIERWEDSSEEFADFNARIANLDDGVATLHTIMDQHQLKADDLLNSCDKAPSDVADELPKNQTLETTIMIEKQTLD